MKALQKLVPNSSKVYILYAQYTIAIDGFINDSVVSVVSASYFDLYMVPTPKFSNSYLLNKNK